MAIPSSAQRSAKEMPKRSLRLPHVSPCGMTIDFRRVCQSWKMLIVPEGWLYIRIQIIFDSGVHI
jgi:hypothetical protein